jgi:hypothetical protein
MPAVAARPDGFSAARVAGKERRWGDCVRARTDVGASIASE